MGGPIPVKDGKKPKMMKSKKLMSQQSIWPLEKKPTMLNLVPKILGCLHQTPGIGMSRAGYVISILSLIMSYES
jgi:hypothetical protein